MLLFRLSPTFCVWRGERVGGLSDRLDPETPVVTCAPAPYSFARRLPAAARERARPGADDGAGASGFMIDRRWKAASREALGNSYGR